MVIRCDLRLAEACKKRKGRIPATEDSYEIDEMNGSHVARTIVACALCDAARAKEEEDGSETAGNQKESAKPGKGQKAHRPTERPGPTGDSPPGSP